MTLNQKPAGVEIWEHGSSVGQSGDKSDLAKLKGRTRREVENQVGLGALAPQLIWGIHRFAPWSVVARMTCRAEPLWSSHYLELMAALKKQGLRMNN